MTPEQRRVPYIEEETPREQRKILLSLLTPPLASFPEGGYVLGARADEQRQEVKPQILEISSLSDESAAGRQINVSGSRLGDRFITQIMYLHNEQQTRAGDDYRLTAVSVQTLTGPSPGR